MKQEKELSWFETWDKGRKRRSHWTGLEGLISIHNSTMGQVRKGSSFPAKLHQKTTTTHALKKAHALMLTGSGPLCCAKQG